MFQQTVTETCFFLPDDGDSAKSQFLQLLHSPGETWISAYGFTLPELAAEIKAADANGVLIHLLLDHTQACGPAEKAIVQDLAATLLHGDITITTAGENSHATTQIHHWKAMVVDALDGGEPYCWRGSVNFSPSGFNQGNEASCFRSAIWGGKFIAVFDEHRNWAREHEPQYQPYAVRATAPVPPAPVETIPLPAGVHVGDTETSLPLPDGRIMKTVKHADGSLTQEFYGSDGKLQFPITTTNMDGSTEVAS